MWRFLPSRDRYRFRGSPAPGPAKPDTMASLYSRKGRSVSVEIWRVGRIKLNYILCTLASTMELYRDIGTSIIHLTCSSGWSHSHRRGLIEALKNSLPTAHHLLVIMKRHEWDLSIRIARSRAMVEYNVDWLGYAAGR
jgi:hypothetical protein